MGGKLFKYVKPLDIVICLFVLLIAVLLFLLPFSSRAGRAVVISYIDGGRCVYLAENTEIFLESNGCKLTVCAENGEVYVSESDCPDGVCVHTGRISKENESILCVPAGVLITVSGGEDFDAVAW